MLFFLNYFFLELGFVNNYSQFWYSNKENMDFKVCKMVKSIQEKSCGLTIA